MRRSLIFVSCLLFLNSCIQEFEPELEFNGQLLVVDGIFTTDSLVKVGLTSTSKINGQSFPSDGAIDDALIILLNEDDIILDTLKFDPNSWLTGSQAYKSEIIAGSNLKYKLSIKLSSGSSYLTIGQAPKNIPIQSVSIDSLVYKNEGSDVKYNIEFNDPVEEVNYYVIRIKHYVKGARTDELLNFEPLDKSLATRYSTSNMLLFDDKNINGLKAGIQLRVKKSSYMPPGNEPYRVVLENVTEDVYKFLYSRNFQVNSENDPFSQPVQIFSNIPNGVGVFGGRAIAEYKLP